MNVRRWVFLIGIVMILVLSACSDGPAKDGTPNKNGTVPMSLMDLSRLGAEASRQEMQEGLLKKGNIDLSKSTVQYFARNVDAGAGITYPAEKEPLSIVDFAPTGELPMEMNRPTIYVMFNHPMVPLAKLGEPITETPLMKITPAVKGVYRWYGTRVMSFQPDAPLIDQPFYTVTIPPEVKSLGGRTLDKEFKFEFFTETVKVVNFYTGNDPRSYSSTYEVPMATGQFMVLEFNQPVEPEHFKQFLSVEMRSEKGSGSAGFIVTRPFYPVNMISRVPRALLIALEKAPPEATEVKVKIKEGSTPRPGYPTHKPGDERSFRTVSAFRISDMDFQNYNFPMDNKPGALPVYVRFSHGLDLESAKVGGSLQVNKQPKTPASLDVYGTTLRIGIADLQPNDIVSFSAASTFKDIYARPLTNPAEVVSVKVPAPYPFLIFPRGFQHLEAAFDPKFIWEGRNLNSVSLGAIGKDRFDYPSWYMMGGYVNDPPTEPFDITRWRTNKVNYTVVDLKPYLNKQGFGTAYYNFKNQYTEGTYNRSGEGNLAVQVTDLGITTRFAYNRVLVWVNSLSTGKPVADAQVELSRIGQSVTTGKTDSQGLVTFPLTPGQFRNSFNYDGYYALMISAQKGADRADMRASNTVNMYTSTTYATDSPRDVETPTNRVLMFTDRGLYKPSEELAFRGIHWIQTPDGFTPYVGPYTVTLNDPQNGAVLYTTEGTSTASGGFSHRFSLPSVLEPGSYRLLYTIPSSKDPLGGESFTVAHFRKLAFQVTSQVADREFYLGDAAAVNLSASYLAGGAMPNASYTYYWTRRPEPFSPPGSEWKSYVFGPGNWEGERTLSDGQGKLGGQGMAIIQTNTSGQEATGSAYQYALETTVQDIDRQAIANSARILVHPASFYIGAKFASGSTDGWWSRFISTGQNTKVNLALLTPKGQKWSPESSVKATVQLGSWKVIEQQGVYGRINSRWEYVESIVSSQTLKFGGGQTSFDFQVKEAGDYLLSLEAKDPQGRLTKTVLRFYASGSNWVRRASETPSTIDLIVDKDEYLPGETARILVRSPLQDGDYLMTIEREGIYEEKILKLKGGQSLIEIPVLDKFVPVFYVALTSFTKREDKPADHFSPDLGRPRGLFGITGIRVSTKPIELDVQIIPSQKAYNPGSMAEVTVRVTKNGQPVANTEVTALAVDRGVLDLINYHVPNPIEFFYDPYNFPLAVHGDDSRRLLMKPVTFDTSKLTGGGGEKLQERKDFRPLALFEPFVTTDSKGEAKVQFKLPDSLTTYRVTAMALNGNRLGLMEGEILVQNPINVRTALPRQFRNRDTAAAGVVLQNLTSVPQKVNITAESTILSIGGEKTKTVEIPANGVYELPFLLSATKPGEGTITFTVRSDVVNEKVVETVIVERPLVKEAFTTVGTITKEASTEAEGLIIPSQISPGYGSLTVKGSSTLRPYMEPALDRLRDVPNTWDSLYYKLTYCFAVIYDKREPKFIQNLLSQLADRQLPDGGIYTGSWAYSPYVADPDTSLVTAHLMIFAAGRGYGLNFKTPDLSGLKRYLAGLKSNKPFELDPYFHAYNNYVLALGGRGDSDYLKKTEAYEDKLGLGGYGLLTQAYLTLGDKTGADRTYQRSKNFVMIGTQTIDLKETYEVRNYWSSEVAEMALLLKNSVDRKEDKGLIQRIAGSLNRSTRYWQTRNDDFWTLMAFIPLLDAEGPGSGNAGFTLNGNGATLVQMDLTQAVPQGSKTLEFFDGSLLKFPRDTLVPLQFLKKGETPVYYTTILRYALPNETAIARDEGLEVHLRYESLDGALVKDDALKLGETYRVRVDLSSTKRRQKVELKVPIPSGVEIVDPTFVTSGKFANKGGTTSETINREAVYGDTIDVVGEGTVSWTGDDWYWYWYRPETFAYNNIMVYRWSDFYTGTRTVTFLIRVTTPGIYPTPPAMADLEFEPEVFGRSEGKLFVIKP